MKYKEPSYEEWIQKQQMISRLVYETYDIVMGNVQGYEWDVDEDGAKESLHKYFNEVFEIKKKEK